MAAQVCRRISRLVNQVILIFRTIAPLAIEIARHPTLPRFNAASRLAVFQSISLIAASGDSAVKPRVYASRIYPFDCAAARDL